MKSRVLLIVMALVLAGLIAVPWLASYFYIFIFTEMLGVAIHHHSAIF